MLATRFRLMILNILYNGGSITPGHPEYGLTEGAETIAGPLVQGFANLAGMATAQALLTAKDNKPDMQIIDHFMCAIVRDGDMMAGVAHEAASFAGNNKLSGLIFCYDN